MNIDQLITAFIEKSIAIGDLDPLDAVYQANQLLILLELPGYEKEELTELTILENYIPLEKIGDQNKLKGGEK